MKTIITLTSVAAFLSFVACTSGTAKSEQTNQADTAKTENVSPMQDYHIDTTKLKPGDGFYQCSMHANVNAMKQGICPECEMELTLMKKQ